MKKLLKGEKLQKRAEELGIECSGTEIRHINSGEHWSVYEADLQNKVMEVERHIREHRLWIIALISAIASVLSAITALIAIYLK